jgi:hypothetical protein
MDNRRAISAIADALQAFWNASIGAAHQSQDAQAMAMASMLSQGFAAMADQLNASIAVEPPKGHDDSFTVEGAVITSKRHGWQLTVSNAGSNDKISADAVAYALNIYPMLKQEIFEDHAVDQFANAMKDKLDRKRQQGFSGGFDSRECTAAKLSTMLREHVEKGDPMDVALLALMLWHRAERILPAA